jgi:CRISPR-associated protein Cas2
MSREAARRYVIAYDIPDDARRTRLATCLAGHGDRVQYSVFVVDGRPASLVRLRRAVTRLIDPRSDSVLICDLGPLGVGLDRRYEVIGVARPITDSTVIVL